MEAIKVPSEKKPLGNGFAPFELQIVKAPIAGIGQKSQKAYFKVEVEEDDTPRIIMAEEAAYICGELRREHLPLIEANNPISAAQKKTVKGKQAYALELEELLIEEVKDLTPLVCEESGFLPQEGDMAVWADNAVGRNDNGLHVI